VLPKFERVSTPSMVESREPVPPVSSSTRDAEPIPPANPKVRIPAPAPTAPMVIGPPARVSTARASSVSPGWTVRGSWRWESLHSRTTEFTEMLRSVLPISGYSRMRCRFIAPRTEGTPNTPVRARGDSSWPSSRICMRPVDFP
jgi:hypothetical protein